MAEVFYERRAEGGEEVLGGGGWCGKILTGERADGGAEGTGGEDGSWAVAPMLPNQDDLIPFREMEAPLPSPSFPPHPRAHCPHRFVIIGDDITGR